MGGNGRGDLAEHMLEPCQGDGYNSDHGIKVYITLLNRQCQGSDGLAPVYNASIIFFSFSFTLLCL
jgi:hypothetical protein